MSDLEVVRRKEAQKAQRVLRRDEVQARSDLS
jgi:hypothetical protein